MTRRARGAGTSAASLSGHDGLGIELRHIRHVIAVAEQGSLTRAAVELGMSVSALSRSVKGVEQAVGSPIFLASSGGGGVTDFGRLFISRGREMLQAAAMLGQHIERNPTLHAGRVAIGVGAKALEMSAGDVALEFIEKFPEVSLEIRCGLVGDLVPGLRGHELDFVVGHPALLRERAELSLDTTLLPAAPLVLAARAGHPLLARPGFTLLDAFDYLAVAAGHANPKLLATVLEMQTRCVSPLARERAWPGVLAPLWSMIEPLMLEADALTLLPPSELADAVRAGRLVPLAAGGWTSSELALMSLRSRPLSSAARLFRDRLLNAYEQRLAEDRRLLSAWFPQGAALPARG
jgi:DNA-binding transcriptional LysR family regulator